MQLSHLNLCSVFVPHETRSVSRLSTNEKCFTVIDCVLTTGESKQAFKACKTLSRGSYYLATVGVTAV